jgi:hypothetical protein
MRQLSDEAKVFVRMAIFGIVVGAGYWFLTYEEVGTVLLIAFGLASGLAAVSVVIVWRRAKRGSAAGESVTEPIPEPGWAPLGIGVGVGAVALGAAFGPWLTIAGLFVAIAGGASWLAAAMREGASVDASTSRPADDHRP